MMYASCSCIIGYTKKRKKQTIFEDALFTLSDL